MSDRFNSFAAVQIGGFSSKVRMLAFAAGVSALGGRVFVANDVPALQAIVEAHHPKFAFVCGMRPSEAGARYWLEAHAIPLLVLDLGFFGRASGPGDANGYNQLGLNRLCWTPPCAVAGDRFAVFGLTITQPRQVSAHPVALVFGQVPGDTQHQLTESQLSQWLNVTAAYWAQKGYRLRYRPHPRFPGLPLSIPHDRLDPACSTVADNLNDADVCRVVTYNSTAGLEALMAGVPVDCAPAAHYAHVAGLQNRHALRDHLHRLAWAQWTCDELKTGEPIRWMNRFADLLPREAAAEAA